MSVDLPIPLRRLRNAQHRSELALRNARALTRPTLRPKVAYLGWAGTGNVGDDAIHEAHRRHLPDVSLVTGPLRDIEAVERLVAISRRPAQLTGLVLGGGTLIGRADWRHRLEATARFVPQPWVMLGAGVEDPSFVASSRQRYAEDLTAWRGLLSKFEQVSVRGPLSAQLLSDAGIDAVVDGDPALLLTPASRAWPPDPTSRGGVAVISVATTEDRYAGAGDVVELVAPSARWLVEQGYQVRALPMHPSDLEPCRRLEALVSGVVALSVCPTVGETLELIGGADLVIGQRLHAVVLAAACGVPFVALDYRPKCRDFLLSLDRPEWGLTLGATTAADVLARTEALVADHDGLQASIVATVAVVRARLRVAAARNQAMLLASARRAS